MSLKKKKKQKKTQHFCGRLAKSANNPLQSPETLSKSKPRDTLHSNGAAPFTRIQATNTENCYKMRRTEEKQPNAVSGSWLTPGTEHEKACSGNLLN
jgi:hypothetical protein